MTRRLLSLAVALLAPLTVLVAQRGEPSRQVEWPYYGGDQGGMILVPGRHQRYERGSSPEGLEWKHWETPLDECGTIPGFFEATPLMIDGVLYVTTPYAALQPSTRKPARNCGDSTARRTSSDRCCQAAVTKLRGTAFWRDGNNLRLC